jgi:peroxiredoxin
MSLKIGQPAPQFELFNSHKNKVSLDSYKGKNVVLLFFPLAFSSVCTKELCSVRDSMSKYEGLQAEVLGISVDSLYTLGKFKEEQGLNFMLLSDFNKEVSQAYDCLYERFGYGMKGVSKRAAFVIDKEGIVRYAEVLENAAEVPDFGKINETLEALSANGR